MLNQHLVVKTYPKAAPNNIVVWKNYRITVLGDQLFRIEHNSEKAFRDEATQTVWYRNMPEQSYAIEENNSFLLVKTKSCELKILEKRADCRIRLNGGDWKRISNDGNLKGTYRTLDCCDGHSHQKTSSIFDYTERPYSIKLGTGVCSASGIAVFDDANSLTLAENGEVLSKRGSGSDEYVFAFGNDYREAIKALYKITGNTPIVPRFALGNWWSRYYVYTQEEYLRLLNRFEERKIPLSVATIDMDWHYSTKMEEDLHIEALGRNTPFYGGNNGWTGYSWNKRLFPDYKALLKEIKEKGLKITLNLHPAGGVRWWEDQYEDMALALGKDPTTLEKIPFDVSSPEFINAYFSVLHKPFEEDGVGFWWIDWQQGTQSSVEGLDPLWALNHYHYLDNALNHTAPLILSRYAGVGSHRYPLGFSGDTFITWKTLEYLPYFTLTASNVGYTWWSHDIGGHMFGEKNDELYVRHVQFGVMSPINRLHSSNALTMTKEPWYYKNGAGEIAQQWLRFRHQLIPYLYSASRKTNQEGIALVEPLYYEWDCAQAYRYKNEYIFGGELLVVPITKKANKDGYARVKAWIP
ncbi:MAG: alpha-xylosidase, partial [Clostridia bacterium]|nr:alpha-xylosidase [Clostridia bacterium]